MKARDRIKLGERTFVKLTKGATVEHDYWFMAHVSRAGLANVRMLEGETNDEFAKRLLEMAMMSGQVLEMLGGLLLPEGTKPDEWTVDMADETAQYLGKLTDPKDKEVINGLVASLLIDFFVTGLISAYRIRTFSRGGRSKGRGRK